MQSEILNSDYAKLFQIPTNEAETLTNSFIRVIKSKHPDVEIDSLQRDDSDVIFVLGNGVKVKFSPPDAIPIFVLPVGYTAKEVVHNFQLCKHLSRNKNLFTEENIALLKRLQNKGKTPSEISELRILIAKAFLIPKSEQERMWTSGTDILPILMRIKNIDDKGIIVNLKVVLINDKRDFRVVYKIESNFFLKLRGINRSVDPADVAVITG